ncbi:MFS transporter [Kiloniella spongiae]|uniref:MFS transporter n=1 Tax=Kiloniella spongiae TaxID=1489064 RepID=A0A0H2MHQ6_9PROT|nr:MFS transporter [Kiloniella spongiae]KLN61721.1 MFS transporter [Kiloniella spongiae]
MFQRRIPEWLRHAPTPGAKGFAVLSGIESISRGILISVFPLVMYRAFQDTLVVSEIYFFVGIISLACGLLVPWLTRFIPRRWMYSLGAVLFIVSSSLAIEGSPIAIALALFSYTVAVVILFVCFNAYVLDYVAKIELKRSETLRLFYSALAWSAGPAGGVWLLQWWTPAPFLVSALGATVLLVVFWWMRLGDGKLITKARAPTPNPVAFIQRFFVQPRLIAGWLFAVIKSCSWWVYIVYLPIYAVEAGLDESIGGIALSVSNSLLFLTPFMLMWIERNSVRHAIRAGFLIGGGVFIAATFSASMPWVTVGFLLFGTLFLILLDICAGLPFLMAVRPSERTEMSAVYSTFRDISGIISPGVAWLVLLVAPISALFATAGFGMFAAWVVAGKLHPRLGVRKQPAVVEQNDIAVENRIVAEGQIVTE